MTIRGRGVRRGEGVLPDLIPGEEFFVFDSRSLTLLETIPALRRDPDLGATNEGVTVVWLR